MTTYHYGASPDLVSVDARTGRPRTGVSATFFDAEVGGSQDLTIVDSLAGVGGAAISGAFGRWEFTSDTAAELWLDTGMGVRWLVRARESYGPTGVAGPTGPTGPTSTVPGPAGPSGGPVPVGGVDGQVVAKSGGGVAWANGATDASMDAKITDERGTERAHQSSTYGTVVKHGSTAGTTRPAGATFVHWVGTVAPTNATTDDVWQDDSTSPATLRRYTGSAFEAFSGSGGSGGAYISVGVTNIDAASHGDDLSAAIAALPSGGGRVWANKLSYTLTTGISTSVPNLEIVGAGGIGQDGNVGLGATRILVPAGQVGFKFNPSPSTTVFRGPVLRRLHFYDSSGSGAALGGINLYRTSNFLLEDVSTSEFGASHPAFLTDGTGDCSQYGEMRNYRSSNNMIGAKHVLTNGLRYFGGVFQGSQGTPAGSVAVQDTGSSDTLKMFGTVFQNHDVLVDLIGGNDPSLIDCRFEVFTTAAIRCAVHGASVRGGSIVNSLNGGIGTGILLVNGSAGGVFDLDDVDAVASIFTDSRTTPLNDYRLTYPTGPLGAGVYVLPADMVSRGGTFAQLPTYSLIDAWVPPVATTGTWSVVSALNVYGFNEVRESDGTAGRSITYDFTGLAGTYTIILAHRASTNRGKYDVYIDGVLAGAGAQFDGYNAGGAANTWDTVTGFTVTGSGAHTVKFVMSTKNAASSSYVGSVGVIRLVRTGA